MQNLSSLIIIFAALLLLWFARDTFAAQKTLSIFTVIDAFREWKGNTLTTTNGGKVFIAFTVF